MYNFYDCWTKTNFEPWKLGADQNINKMKIGRVNKTNRAEASRQEQWAVEFLNREFLLKNMYLFLVLLHLLFLSSVIN